MCPPSAGVVFVVAAKKRAEHPADAARGAVRDGRGPLGRRLDWSLRLHALHRMLPCILARALPAFFDLGLQFGAHIPLAAAAAA